MGLFGPSRKKKFVRSDASNLANYLKNNAIKAGGEAYEKCQTVGALPKDIDKALLWYFWSVTFAFRVAHEALSLKSEIDEATRRILMDALIDIDNDYFKSVTHAPYEETFSSVSDAAKIIKASGSKPLFEIAAMFMLHAVRSIAGLQTQDQKFTVVQLLAEGTCSLPSLKSSLTSIPNALLRC